MPRRVKPDDDDANHGDELEDVRASNAELCDENAKLRQEVERRKKENAELAGKMLDEEPDDHIPDDDLGEDVPDESYPYQRPSENTPKPAMGVFPMIGAVDVICRWGIWLYVENSGTTAFWAGVGVSVTLGVILLAVLCEWIDVGVKLIGWLMIPKCLIVLVALLVAANVFSNGAIWTGVANNPDGHPTIAVLMIVTAFVFVASPASERAINAIVEFLNHPIDTIGKLL